MIDYPSRTVPGKGSFNQSVSRSRRKVGTEYQTKVSCLNNVFTPSYRSRNSHQIVRSLSSVPSRQVFTLPPISDSRLTMHDMGLLRPSYNFSRKLLGGPQKSSTNCCQEKQRHVRTKRSRFRRISVGGSDLREVSPMMDRGSSRAGMI
jgi:hypothetical protein